MVRVAEEVKVLYLDEATAAVEKPAGLLSVPGKGAEKQDCLLRRAEAELGPLFVVHRLDMDTSGVMLFARTADAQRALFRAFRRREVEKVYEAEVEGVLEPAEGTARFALRKDMSSRLPPRHLVDCVRGKAAVTHWRVIGRTPRGCRVELRPETGRSHQLRVHLLTLGHPIIGDPIYGSGGERMRLHAREIVFPHPVTGVRVRVCSPVPF